MNTVFGSGLFHQIHEDVSVVFCLFDRLTDLIN